MNLYFESKISRFCVPNLRNSVAITYDSRLESEILVLNLLRS